MSTLSPDAINLASAEVRAFFKDPQVAKTVINTVIKKRPATWGKRSNAPYYAEHYAKDLQRYIDKMIEDKQDLVFMYKDFNTKPSSVYLRVNQSFLFLRENMDDEYKYANFQNQVLFLREKDCVRVTYKEQFQNGTGKLKAHSVFPASRAYVWKDKIDTFLNDPIALKLHIDKLLLTKEQIEDVNNSLIGVKGIIFNIDYHNIKIIKVNDAQ